MHCFEKISLHQVLQGCSKMGLWCYRCQLHFYRTICKPSANPGVSSALLTDLSYCLWSHNCKLAGRRRCSRSRDHGYLGHSWCNILIPSGPFQALLHIHHFNLMMECCYARATLWLGKSDNAQFLWEDQVTWKPSGPSISIQSLRLNYRSRAVSQKEDTYLQRMARVCSKILRFALLYSWGAKIEPTHYFYVLLTPLSLLSHYPDVVSNLHSSLDLLQSPLLF